MGGRPDENVEVECTSWCTALLWIVPAKVEGMWHLPQGDLTLKQTFQMVSGTLKSGNSSAQISGRQTSRRSADVYGWRRPFCSRTRERHDHHGDDRLWRKLERQQDQRMTIIAGDHSNKVEAGTNPPASSVQFSVGDSLMPLTRDRVTSWRRWLMFGILIVAVANAACGGAEPPAQPAAEPPAAAAPPPPPEARRGSSSSSQSTARW